MKSSINPRIDVILISIKFRGTMYEQDILDSHVEALQKGMDLVSESVARVEGTVENQQ